MLGIDEHVGDREGKERLHHEKQHDAGGPREEPDGDEHERPRAAAGKRADGDEEKGRHRQPGEPPLNVGIARRIGPDDLVIGQQVEEIVDRRERIVFELLDTLPHAGGGLLNRPVKAGFGIVGRLTEREGQWQQRERQDPIQIFTRAGGGLSGRFQSRRGMAGRDGGFRLDRHGPAGDAVESDRSSGGDGQRPITPQTGQAIRRLFGINQIVLAADTADGDAHYTLPPVFARLSNPSARFCRRLVGQATGRAIGNRTHQLRKGFHRRSVFFALAFDNCFDLT